MGPDDFSNSVRLMKGVLPLERVRWRIHEREGKRIATITVIEKDRVNSNFSLSGGFNRVDGWRFGPALELSKDPDLWTPPRLKLFGELTYGFSNKTWNYILGTQTSGECSQQVASDDKRTYPSTHSCQGPDRSLPHDGEQLTMAFLYGGDYRDYYERDGSELSVRWHPVGSPHSATLTALDENHWSLGKTTDWSLFPTRCNQNRKHTNYPRSFAKCDVTGTILSAKHLIDLLTVGTMYSRSNTVMPQSVLISILHASMPISENTAA